MAVEPLQPQQEKAANSTQRSETRFPAYDLATAMEVPRLIHTRGGGTATPDHLASFLDYNGTNNGAYLAKVAAAKAFGLIAKNGPVFVPTALAHQVLSPVYPHDAKKALVEAFFNVEFFKRFYEDFKGRELPPEFGLKNALRTQYGIVPSRVDLALRCLLDSAETAGFFETKAGARTHLIVPLIQAIPPLAAPVPTKESELTGNEYGGGGGGPPSPPPPPTPPAQPTATSAQIGDVKAKYLAALIKAFEEKTAQGELDENLMERIERLLGERK